MITNHINKPEKNRWFFICIISIFFLFFSFFSNLWNVAETNFFHYLQRDCESFILGRIVKSRQDGIFSAGGMLGTGTSNNYNLSWILPEQIRDQYSAYLKNTTVDKYSPYMSQPGGQGIIFSFLDRIIPLSPINKLNLFYMLTSLLSAIALTLIILWFYWEVGLSVAISVLCSMVFSQWLTVFGRSLWWSIWAFYLPMIAVMYFLKYSLLSTNKHFIAFSGLCFISIFLKCMINGYEYITTTLIMMIIPFLYYSIVNKSGRYHLITGFVSAVSGSLVAIILSLTILSFQIASVKGSMINGFEHIIYSLGKRTYGNANIYPDLYIASLTSSVTEVTLIYLKGIFFDLGNYITTSNPIISHIFFKIRYSYVIVLFMIMSFFVFFYQDKKKHAKQRQKEIALIFTTWASILAPLSWFVIFKGHSFIHTHLNNIVWHMPFIFWGFAICGLSLKKVLPDLNGSFSQ